jgi:hypothetical protein
MVARPQVTDKRPKSLAGLKLRGGPEKPGFGWWIRRQPQPVRINLA